MKEEGRGLTSVTAQGLQDVQSIPSDTGFSATHTVVNDPSFFVSSDSLIKHSVVHFTHQLLVKSSSSSLVTAKSSSWYIGIVIIFFPRSKRGTKT